jgi:hypothetical protein
MKKILAGVVLSLVAVSTAYALEPTTKQIPVDCMGEKRLTEVLGQFGERLLLLDVQGELRARHSLWVNPETRSWTFVETNALTKEHCILAFGTALEPFVEVNKGGKP